MLDLSLKSDGHEPKVLVIIPVFNERDCILDTVKAIKATGYDYVVINDGSTDDTFEI